MNDDEDLQPFINAVRDQLTNYFEGKFSNITLELDSMAVRQLWLIVHCTCSSTEAVNILDKFDENYWFNLVHPLKDLLEVNLKFKS